MSLPSVYFARAVDFVDPVKVAEAAARARDALARFDMRLIDPLDYEIDAGPGVVEMDLAVLRRCDAMLVDMTIPDRNYIGCVAELVYAHSWRIPAVVYVGSTDYGRRPWLQYHATQVCRSQDEAVAALHAALSGTVAWPFGQAPR